MVDGIRYRVDGIGHTGSTLPSCQTLDAGYQLRPHPSVFCLPSSDSYL